MLNRKFSNFNSHTNHSLDVEGNDLKAVLLRCKKTRTASIAVFHDSRNTHFPQRSGHAATLIKAILLLPTLLPTLDNYTKLDIYSTSRSNLPIGRLRLPEDIPGRLCVI